MWRAHGGVAMTNSSGDELWRELGLAAPARRALLAADITTLEDLKGKTRSEVAALHGMGPHALERLEPYLKKRTR